MVEHLQLPGRIWTFRNAPLERVKEFKKAVLLRELFSIRHDCCPFALRYCVTERRTIALTGAPVSSEISSNLSRSAGGSRTTVRTMRPAPCSCCVHSVSSMVRALHTLQTLTRRRDFRG